MMLQNFFFRLNTAEHELYPAHKCLNCWHLNIYEQDKFNIWEY